MLLCYKYPKKVTDKNQTHLEEVHVVEVGPVAVEAVDDANVMPPKGWLTWLPEFPDFVRPRKKMLKCNLENFFAALFFHIFSDIFSNCD